MSRAESFQPISRFDQFLSKYRYSRVFKVLPEASGQSVVDMGCGKGELVHLLRSQGFDAWGIDLQRGDKILAGNLNQPLNLHSNSVDFVTSLANIEHLEHPDVNLSEMYRILKPGGKLVLTTPSTAAKPVLEFLAFKLKLIDEREILDHKRYYSKKSLAKALSQAGFKQFKISHFQVGFNLQVLASK